MITIRTYLSPEQIEEYFSEYRDYMFWIMLSFTLVSVIVQYIFNLKLSRKVESYRNDLKKGEIKFSRYNELQIESLKQLYDQIVSFHFAYWNLVNPISCTHNSYKNNIQNFKEQFRLCMNSFHRNKIFLTESLIHKIKDLHTNFQLIDVFFIESLSEINSIEEEGLGNISIIYENSDDESESIKRRIEKLKSKTRGNKF